MDGSGDDRVSFNKYPQVSLTCDLSHVSRCGLGYVEFMDLVGGLGYMMCTCYISVGFLGVHELHTSVGTIGEYEL